MKSFFFITLFISFTLNSYFFFSQCTLPNLNIGNDTTLCQGDSLIIKIDTIYKNVYWSNIGEAYSLTINNEGTYTVNSIVPGSNLIINGDFEQGNTSFTTDYVLGSVDGGGAFGLLTNVQTYEITTSLNNAHINFPNCTHQGNMMVVNGATTAGKFIWCQQVTVQNNMNYVLSAEVTNAISVDIVPNLLFSINGQQVSNVFSTSANACEWLTYSGTWFSSNNTSANVCIMDINLEGPGNDFAIDNIKLIPQCVYTDDITVNYDSISYYLVDSIDFCSDLLKSVSIDSVGNTYNYLWSTGEQSNIINPNTSGYYYVEIISPNQCSYLDSVYVNVIQAPTANFELEFLNDNAPFMVKIDNISLNSQSYFWNVSGQYQFTDNEIKAHQFEYQYMGEYSVTLIAYNEYCDDTLIKNFKLNQEVNYPNFFSPNNDGNNDTFFIENINPDSFELKLLNRWGNIVFETEDPYFKWDGKDKNGKKCEEGTYFYILQFYNYSGEMIRHQDYIQLIR